MRASRLVRLLGLLQARGRMTASQLAGELEVSQRTVLRDIEALGSAGIPVYAVRGKLGGFELIEGFTSDLPSSRLHQRPPGPASAAGRATIWLSPRGRRLAVLLGRPAGVRVRRSAGPQIRPDLPHPPRLRPGGASLRGDDPPRPPRLRHGWVQAWIPVESAEETVADVLALGGEVEVAGPPELRARVREAALAIARLHGLAESSQS